MAKEKNTEQIGLRVPPSLTAKIAEAADREGRSEADVIRRALVIQLEAQERLFWIRKAKSDLVKLGLTGEVVERETVVWATIALGQLFRHPLDGWRWHGSEAGHPSLADAVRAGR